MSFIEDDLQNAFLIEDGNENALFSFKSQTVRTVGWFETDVFETDNVEGFSSVFVMPENKQIKRGWVMRTGRGIYTVTNRRDDGSGLSYVYLDDA